MEATAGGTHRVGPHPAGKQANAATDVGPAQDLLEVGDVLVALALLEAVAQRLHIRLERGNVHLGDPLILGRDRLRRRHRRDADGHAVPQLRRDAAVHARGRRSDEAASSLTVHQHRQQRGPQVQHAIRPDVLPEGSLSATASRGCKTQGRFAAQMQLKTPKIFVLVNARYFL